MDPEATATEIRSEAGSHSRRLILGASATGLALAVLARSLSQATAQEASPAAEASPSAGGLPPGLGITPLINIPIAEADVPAGGFTLSLWRLTLEPGSDVPASSVQYPEMAFVESGTLICPGARPRYLIHADGSAGEVGDEDVIVNTGEALYVPPNVLDGARNDGSEKLSALIVDLLPMEGMATPMT
jgi:hypothetical protein